MKSFVVKRSIYLYGRKTSVSLEQEFWGGLKDIAEHRDVATNQLITDIDKTRHQGNLSSELRVFVLGYFQDRILAPQPSAEVGK